MPRKEEMNAQKVFTPGEVRSYGLEIGSTHTEPEEKDVAPRTPKSIYSRRS